MRKYSYRNIEQQIAKAKADGWHKLDLNECEVQDQDLLELLSMPNIERLDALFLGCNQLTTLPPEIGRLTSLTTLYLSKNHLISLPPEIGRLTTLTDLYLDNNRLITLPPEIGRLARLTTLCLSNNRLISLPPEIGRLTTLTEFYLDNNRLITLPPEVGQLSVLKKLDLDNNQLTMLPPEIGRLSVLERLDIDDNQLTTLPPEIGQLSALTEFSIGGNHLTTLPPEIGQLTALTEFYLYNNQLITLPPEIGGLAALAILYLNNNRLTRLPPEIGRLAALTEFYLYNNQLTTLPPETGQLVAIERLNLRNNQLTTLPPKLGQLTSMKRLNLRNNRLTTLPPELGQLSVLTQLSLASNRLTSLPSELVQLTALEKLFLHGNDELGIPPEIMGPTFENVQLQKVKPAMPKMILDYYFRIRAAKDRRALNEVKVIIIGQGSVGKTSLVNRIVKDEFNDAEKKTEGIYIEKAWSVPGIKKNERVQVNFWDFGGQEIMHATHQFFLTKRSLYLLVLDARKGENESNIHYWLKIIRSFGGDSPVLVVTNKCDAHHLILNETRLRKDYPSIAGFFNTSCESGMGIKELKIGIAKQIHSQAHVFDPLPKAYFTVKQEMEKLAEEKNYIDIGEYRKLCFENKIIENDEQEGLLRFLHDLGSVLNFNDPDSPLPMRETNVLNPLWVTEGVYKIINDETLAGRNGVLIKKDMSRILDSSKYPAECHSFIVGMMHKFELCFTVIEHEKWLVAELLPKNEPETLEKWDDALCFQYHYDVLPSAIICRFIVRRYEDLTNPPVYWRSGAKLQHDGCKALVRSDCDEGRMYIAVTGPQSCRRSFLSVLRDEFTRIHASIPNLKPQEMVQLPDNPDVTVEYDHLLILEQNGSLNFIPQGARRSYEVAELLDGIEDPMFRGELCESHLFPPLFNINPQNSFADAWEVFCCDVISRHEKTTDIYRRKPPESGVDLYWPSQEIAYQCKSVEESNGKFNITKAVESLKNAIKIQSHLPWKMYVICSNVALTGNQEQQLRAIFPDIKLLTPSFWIPRCREQSRYLSGRFRRLESMDNHRI